MLTGHQGLLTIVSDRASDRSDLA